MREHGDILKPLIAIAGSDECWQWLGKVNAKSGYGHKQWNGKTVLAHRWVYQLFNGWIPQDKVINHLCGNRVCVNPRHLEVTTVAGNCRHGRGTKVSAETVRQIKAALPTLKWGGRKALAEKFGVNVGMISDIKHGNSWADI